MGHVYFLTNPRMPGLVKIGRTAYLNQRLLELNGATGVPSPFVMEHSIETANEFELERLLHQMLAPFRLWTRKEFFEIPLKYAISAADALLANIDFDNRTMPSEMVLTHDTPETLGFAIRDARKAKGLSQGELASLTGCGRRVVSEIELGKKTAEIGIIMRLCQVLGTKVATVL